MLGAYEEFSDLPENRPIAVYSLHEIASEKVMALGDEARNEPRNLYDLWLRTAHAGVDLSHLLGAITDKLRFRETEVAGLEDRILGKEARLKSLRSNRLGHQIDALPAFDEVFRAVRRELPPAGLS